MLVNNTRHRDSILTSLCLWKPYVDWINTFSNSDCQITQLFLQGAVLKSDNSFYSALIEIHFKTPENHKLVRSILLRGSGCVVIPYYLNSMGLNFLVVKQRRVQSGNYSIEFPAGKIEEYFLPRESAAIELFEETGIRINPNELRELAQDIVVCESAFDEHVTWYACQISESAYLKNLTKGHGLIDDGEHITITSISLSYLKKINSFQIKTGLQLLLENGIIGG